MSLKISLVLLSVFAMVSLAGQNAKKADSLLQVLATQDLPAKQEAAVQRAIAYYHPDFSLALSYARRSLQIAEGLEEPLLQAEALEEISHLEQRLGNSDRSLQATLDALQIYESMGLLERQAASYTQLANNYLGIENYALAIDYLNKAITIYSDSDDILSEALAVLNIGEAYRLAGQSGRAASSFQKALNLNETLDSEVIQGYAMGNLGMVFFTDTKFVEAKDYLNQAIQILKPLEDHYSTSVYLAEYGKVLHATGNTREAESYLLEALIMARKAGLKEQVRDISAELVTFYEDSGRFAEALEYQKTKQVYQDSLVNKETVQKIEQIKAGYEIDKRETEISLLNTINRNRTYWIIGLTTGASILVLLTYLLFKTKEHVKAVNVNLSEQKEVLFKREQEKALLLKELNHRIKNNLQMISSLLNLQSHELKGHPAKEALVLGKHRVEALSLIHRKLYREDLDTRIPLNEFIEELVLGLFHGYKAGFRPSFNMIDIDVKLDVAIPLALIINEIIVNALKYAYKNIDNPKLNLVMAKQNGQLDIDIIDNGVGFKTSGMETNNSFGLKLIHSLINQLESTINKIDSTEGTHWKMQVRLT